VPITTWLVEREVVPSMNEVVVVLMVDVVLYVVIVDVLVVVMLASSVTFTALAIAMRKETRTARALGKAILG